MTLLEPLLRRTTFLEEVVADLALDQVEVVRGRAEQLHGVRRFSVVTSRAVAPLDRLLRWSMPLVEPDGVLLAMKGSSAADEVVAARGTLAELGCAEPEVLLLGAPGSPSTTVAVRVAWADPGRVSWPLAAPSDPGASAGRRAGRRGRSSAKSNTRSNRRRQA